MIYRDLWGWWGSIGDLCVIYRDLWGWWGSIGDLCVIYRDLWGWWGSIGDLCIQSMGIYGAGCLGTYRATCMHPMGLQKGPIGDGGRGGGWGRLEGAWLLAGPAHHVATPPSL